MAGRRLGVMTDFPAPGEAGYCDAGVIELECHAAAPGAGGHGGEVAAGELAVRVGPGMKYAPSGYARSPVSRHR
jgi:hypothetical protein